MDRRSVRAARKHSIGAWYLALKSALVCQRCGETHPGCLQFHHMERAQKEASVSDAVRRGWSRTRIELEIAKCEVLCANCHAKHHAAEMADADR